MDAVCPFTVAIPARFASTRLPGKPLRLLAGEPLIVHVARRALATGADSVWVATDDARIAGALAGLDGIHVVHTRADHRSGSDRLAECAQVAGWGDDTIVVNLQGDEPFAPVAGIRAVAGLLADGRARMATLAAPVTSRGELFDPNAVKVVRDADGMALYFSRAPIPWQRDQADGLVFPGPWLRHIGIYGYRAGFLRTMAALPPGQLEPVESLEQLRVLEAGYKIAVGLTPEPFPPGVDTPDDLARAEAWLAGQRRD